MASDGYPKPEPRSARDRDPRRPTSRRPAQQGSPRWARTGREAPPTVPRGLDLTRLHFSPEGVARRPSRDHLMTLDFLGQGAPQRSGGRYEPLPRWGNPRRAVAAGLLAAALLGAVVSGGLANTARGAEPGGGDEAPTRTLRGEQGSTSVEDDDPAGAGRDPAALPRAGCVEPPDREDGQRGSPDAG